MLYIGPVITEGNVYYKVNDDECPTDWKWKKNNNIYFLLSKSQNHFNLF
jgi:hypothetical protein